MNKRNALCHLAHTQIAEAKIGTLTSSGSVNYTTDKKNSIILVKIPGAEVRSGSKGRAGVGVVGEDGKVRIGARVHGECFLDGYEFARVLKEKGSPCYGGEYDSEHFIYRVPDTQVELFSDLDFSPGAISFNLTFDAIVPEDKSDITTLEMYLVSDSLPKYAAKRKTTGAGVSTFINAFPKSITLKKIIQAATDDPFDLPIKYSSFKLYSGSTVPGEYQGFTQLFDIGTPLYSAYLGYRYVYDEAELVNGRITRRIALFRIDADTEINRCDYSGFRVYAIPLPSDISEPYMDSDYYTQCYDVYEAAEGWKTFFIPDGDGKMYVYFDEEISTDEEAKETLIGQVFYYPVKEWIQEIDKLKSEIKSGYVSIEACTNTVSRLEVDYYY